jgi:phospholipase/lecithinase/hemolysin
MALGVLFGMSSCASLPANCFSDLPHSKLVVFGDSYSDVGNLMVDLGHPYNGGRISNGLLAVEHLAAKMETTDFPSYHPLGCRGGYNYAVVGGNIRGSSDEDLLCQVNKYLERVNDVADPDALYFVMMGGNDVRQLNVNLSNTERDAELNSILDALFDQLERLLNFGVKKLLVANSGNMGRLPSSITDEVEVELEDYSNQFNTLFNDRMNEPMVGLKDKYPGAAIEIFDLFFEMSFILNNPNLPQHDFVNIEEGCFDVEADDKWHVECQEGTDAVIDKFVFFDSVHATAKVHKLLADKITLAAPP